MKNTSIALMVLTGMVLAVISVSRADEGTDGIHTALKADDPAIVLSGEGCLLYTSPSPRD